jgi:VanZ family protein
VVFDQRKRLGRRALRISFFAGLFALLCGTLAPVAIRVPLLSDKIEHFLAFLVLALLGLGAFGRKNVVALALALAAIGGLIEVLQGSSFVGRDAELLDWIADLAGIAIVLPWMRLRTLAAKQPKESER